MKPNVNVNPVSNLQKTINDQLFELLDDFWYDNYETDQYYEWLKNPKTKHDLQIDILITFKERVLHNEKLIPVKLAIEVQGQQHFKFIKEFHKSIKDFKRQKYRDRIKLEICKEKNVLLIRIPYKHISNVKRNFKNYLLQRLVKLTQLNEITEYSRKYLIDLLSDQNKYKSVN